MGPSATVPLLPETVDSTTRYLDTLAGLDPDALRGPSGLPDWSRAFVVAHVSRNADAFDRVLSAARDGRPATMYADAETRDRDIAETVRRLDPASLVEDARQAAGRLQATWSSCTADPDTAYARLPDAVETFPLSSVGRRRRAEVEIHHADLDVGYSPADWPDDFALALIHQRHEELGGLGPACPSMVLSSTDVDGLWKLGVGPGPTIHGTVGDLGWWLVGRGSGAGLTSSTGELPDLGRWR